MFKKLARRTLPGIAAIGLGIYLLPSVIGLAQFKDQQTLAYDYALEVLSHDDPAAAQEGQGALMGSIKLFRQGLKRDYSDRFFLPPPDQEMAALAMFHEGNVLRQLKKVDKALAAYVESLRLNSGQRMLLGVSPRDDQSHQYGRDVCIDPHDKLASKEPVVGDACQLARLEKEADDTRNNILSLLNEHPELKPQLENPGGVKFGQGNEKADAQSGKKSQLPGGSPAPSAGHADDKSI
jgi:hypothetical protein